MVLLNELEKDRIKSRNTSILLKCIGAIIILLSLILAIFVHASLVCLVLIGGVVIYFSIFIENKYEKKLFKEETVYAMLKKSFLPITEKYSVEANQIFGDNKIMPPRKETHFDLCFESKAGNINFYVTRALGFEYLDEKNKYCNFKGLLISFKSAVCYANTKIIACSKNTSHNDTEMLRTSSTGDIEFDNFYNTYSRGNISLGAVLNQKTIESLNKLSDLFPEDKIVFRFNYGKITVAIENDCFFEKKLLKKNVSISENCDRVKKTFGFIYDLVLAQN